jgi:hypothetical protein
MIPLLYVKGWENGVFCCVCDFHLQSEYVSLKITIDKHFSEKHKEILAAKIIINAAYDVTTSEEKNEWRGYFK